MTSDEIWAAAKAHPGNPYAPTIEAATYSEAVFFYWLTEWTRCWTYQALVSGQIQIQHVNLTDLEGLVSDLCDIEDVDPEDLN